MWLNSYKWLQEWQCQVVDRCGPIWNDGCHEVLNIHVLQMMTPLIYDDPLTFPFDFYMRFTLSFYSEISGQLWNKTFDINYHGPQRMNYICLSKLLTFPLASPAGQGLHLPSQMSPCLINELLWHFVNTFMSSTGWNVITSPDLTSSAIFWTNFNWSST